MRGVKSSLVFKKIFIECPEDAAGQRRSPERHRDRRMALLDGRRAQKARAGVRPAADRPAVGAHPPGRGAPALHGDHALHQHDPGSGRAGLPGEPGHRAQDPLDRALERDGDGGAGQSGVGGHRRAHLDLRVGGDPLRDGLQPFLPRGHAGTRGGHRLHPGARVAGHLRPGVPRGAAGPAPAGELPARVEARGRALVLSAPVAHARFLAVPDGLDGAFAAHGDLPGPLLPLPG
jgi:hypothetical protein